jgi:putative SOS response-associated peptidase YedK
VEKGIISGEYFRRKGIRFFRFQNTKNISMCNFKSEKQKYDELVSLYDASFACITEEVDLIKEKFSIMLKRDDALKAIGSENSKELGMQMLRYNEKNALPANLTKEELTEMRWYQRFLSAYNNDTEYERYYENAFDYFPTHILTAGEPDKFKMFRWGLVPFWQKDEAKAMKDRLNTVNCIHEEMWEKPSFRDAIKNGQRCLIPVTGFFEWRWLDEAGTIKIPYYVTFRDQKIRSMAGLYSRWKNPHTGEYYYSYTLLTCPANTIMEYVHNSKKRMPVFIDKENEKDWLNRDLKKDDIMDLCRPYQDPSMRAYTISKMLTTRGINLNVPEVRAPFNYNDSIQQANEFLQRGDKKKAIAVFKEFLNASADVSKVKDEELKLIGAQGVKAELEMA